MSGLLLKGQRLFLMVVILALLPSVVMAQPSGPTCATATPNGSGTTHQIACNASVGSWPTSLSPGDNVLFQRGCTYHMNNKYRITADGTSGNKILIGTYGSGAAPILNGNAIKVSQFYGFEFDGANHVIVDGLEFHDHGQAFHSEQSDNITIRRNIVRRANSACVLIAKGSDDATVEYNQLYDCGLTTNGESVYFATDPSKTATEDIVLRPIVRANTAINETTERMEFKPGTRDGIIEHNYLEGGNNGILVSHWGTSTYQNDHKIRYNLIKNMKGASSVYGIAVRSGAEIHHNVISTVGRTGTSDTNTPGIRIHNTSSASQQTINAHHNTIYNVKNEGLQNGGGTNVSFSNNNLVWASGSGNFGSNPLFQNPGADDFRLQAGSPAGGFGAYAIGAPLIPVGHTACLGEEQEIPIPPGTEIVADYGWDNAATDESVVENDGTATGTAYSTSSPIAGTHSLLFDAATDVMTVPNVGHTPTQGTIRTLVRVVNCTGAIVASAHYIYGETTIPAYGNRKQIYLTEVAGECKLNLGWGSSHTTLLNLATLVPATNYHLVVTWDGVNVRPYLSEIGVTAPIELGSASYTGLTAKPSTYAWGNNGYPANNTEALRGRLDEGKVWNRALTAAEVVTDYNALHGEIEPPPPTPDLVPLAFTSGTIGVDGNNIVHMTMPNPTPDAYDPGECLNLTTFALTYADADVTLANCSLSGLVATFTASSAVANNQVEVRMYRNRGLGDEQNILLTNTATTPQPPKVDLEQDENWRWPVPNHCEGCRWRHAEGTTLEIPSPSPVIIARVAIVNHDDTTPIPPQSYGLHCAEGTYPTIAATLTTALTGANNDLLWSAKERGTAGNAITIQYIDPGVTTASESIVVTNLAIAITLRRSAGGVLSTADQIKTALLADAPASALVTAADVAANDGSGVVIAMSATALTGGIGDASVRLTISTADFPLAYFAGGDTVRTANQPTTEVAGFTLPAGIAFQTGGTVQQTPSTTIQPEIAPNSAIVFEPVLTLKLGVARGTQFECCYEIEPDGQQLDTCDPLRMVVGTTKAR